MIIRRIIDWGSNNPKKIFPIDGFGAIFSALMLGIVLVRLESVFGIPVPTLYFLAILPCLFAVYDFYCYFKIEKRLGLYLKVIAIINIIYCFISIGLAIYHIEEIKNLGWIYILSEVLIVFLLSIIELRIAKNLNKSSKI